MAVEFFDLGETVPRTWTRNSVADCEPGQERSLYEMVEQLGETVSCGELIGRPVVE